MKNSLFLKITLNVFAVVLLFGLLATPIYFAGSLGKVAGIKSESKYLLASQIENFPNLTVSQQAKNYKITLTKFAPNQAYLGIFILNNPTQQTQTYKIEKLNGEPTVFFAEDINDEKTSISLPAATSTTISLISKEGSTSTQTVEFKISVQ